jgi:hypothetical protein
MRFFLMAMAAIMLAGCAPDDREMTLDRLLTLHADARGGAGALENIKTISVDIDITEPTFEVEGRYRASRQGYMRIDIFADGERVYTEALGPDGGWQMYRDGTVADVTPEGEAALESGVTGNLFGLHEFQERGYELEFLGSAERNGGTFWEVKQTGPDGASQHLFFDKDTFLIASDIATNALHPDVDATEVPQETFYSDYRETDGVVFSNRSETRNLDTGEVMQTIVTTDRKLNPTLDTEQFVRPVVYE